MTLPYRSALITGISGQDGALLAAQLLAAGVRVTGTHRLHATPDFWRLHELGIANHAQLSLRALDIGDTPALHALFGEVDCEVVFHLAGQSRVAESFRDPLGSVVANGNHTLALLEAVRAMTPHAHVVLAASAEIFSPATQMQDEHTALAPSTPYGLSKLLAHAAAAVWRASFGQRVSSAVLFNHESELRDPAFVTRKISQAAARIALGREESIALGNLDARRDFGYAPDYVRALATMAARPAGADYVLATGQSASIRDFASAAFAAAGIELAWRGRGADEVAVDTGDRVRIRVDASLLRPVDAPLRFGDARKAQRELGFAPDTDLARLAQRMVAADLARERGEPLPRIVPA